MLLASCAAPKYGYYFDHYDYNAGKRKKTAPEGIQIASAVPQEGVEPMGGTGSPNETVLASLKKEVPAASPRHLSPKENTKVQHLLSAAERKGLKKELKSALKKYKDDRKTLTPDGTRAGGDKNQLVALLLAIFLGGLGIHRFYLGRIWTAIAQLLLLVVLGVTGVALYALQGLLSMQK